MSKKVTIDVKNLRYRYGNRRVRFAGGIETLRESIVAIEKMIEVEEDRLNDLKTEFEAMKELERRASKEK